MEDVKGFGTIAKTEAHIDCRVHGEVHEESSKAGGKRIRCSGQEAWADPHSAGTGVVQIEVAGHIHNNWSHELGAAQGRDNYNH